MKSEDMTVEDMEDLLREFYREKFGGSLEELKEKASNPEGLNPGLDRCTIIGTNEDKDIEVRFQDTPECMDAMEEYREILKAALGGSETVYKTLK
ncbi:hypothetical protein KKH23_04310 [Patescibacteria group bacterium]|nr:hypothetical protein [Patescibacteria group bacterium]